MTSLKYYLLVLITTSSRGGHRTHNPKVEGSNPSPATKSSKGLQNYLLF
jgi:hypothetical protein